MVLPPARYSVGQLDFDPEIGRRLRIFCDGVLMDKVVEYDCDAGTVLRCKLDDKGQLQLNAKRDEVLREIVRGAVTVELV
jgi:hypothetical protein